MLRKRATLFLSEGVQEYTDSKEAEYLTQVGVAGELILYRITLHQMLSAKTKPEVYKVWAAGKWQKMIHDEIEEDGED